MRLSALFFTALMLATQIDAADEQPTSREMTVTCGKEEIVFDYWTIAAGRPNISDDEATKENITKLALRTADGRTLAGLRLNASGQSKGVVLVIQGNAWAAVTIARDLEFLRQAGFDVLVYDFRGYAMSRPGIPRFKAIIQDYREIFASVRALKDHRIYIYSFSGGGVVAIDALSDQPGWNAVVVDSAPARLPEFLKCPANAGLDPIDHLPANTSNMLFISSISDGVVHHAEALPLLDAAAARGADVRSPKNWSHPFQPPFNWLHPFRDRLDSPNNERQKLLIEYFTTH